MQRIFLAKPGGQREGPYTLEQINRDLANKKYSDEDFWAWHEGLSSWTPLYSLPGVLAKEESPESESQAATPKTRPEASTDVKARPTGPTVTPAGSKVEAEGKQEAPSGKSARTETPEPSLPEFEPEAKQPAVRPMAEAKLEPQKVEAASAPLGEQKAPEIFVVPSMSSGKPFSALEQIFVFTTGEGPSAFKSEVTSAMLLESVGETLEIIRSRASVDVIGRTDATVVKTIGAGSIPNSAWRALSAIKPAIAQQAKDGEYHLCVRAFPVESDEAVALFLLYNKKEL